MRILAVLALCLVAGCYRSHVRPGDEASADGAAHRDGSRVDEDGAAIGPDGSSGDPRDSGISSSVDAGTVLPPEPDPDLGPDARPSDYPEADDWDDLPPPSSSSAPCCTMDEPILVTSRDRDDEQVGGLHPPAALAWGPGSWGLLTTRLAGAPDFEMDPHPAIFELDADGHPLGTRVVLDGPSAYAGALRWAEGRWAVAATVDGAGIVTRLLDRERHPATDWQPVLPGVGVPTFDMARMTTGHQWLAVGHDRAALRLQTFDESGVGTEITRDDVEPGQTLAAVGLRSRAAVLIGGFTGRPNGNVVTIVGAPPGLDELGQVRLSRDSALVSALAAVRDVVVAVVARQGELVADVVDPFSISQIGTTQTLATLARDPDARVTVGAAGSSKLGLVGVCYGEGGDPDSHERHATIDFRIIDANGVLRGAPVTAIDTEFRGSMVNCAVGTDDRGFLVAWFDADQGLWVRRIHVR